MPNTFNFRLVSPEAELMAEPVFEATVPGSEGEFGVRAGHMPLVATLRPGVVAVQAANNPNPVRYFVSGGFAEVNATACAVLAEQAVDVLSLNAGQITVEINGLRARLAQALDEGTRAALRTDLAIAQARLTAAQTH